MSDDINHVEAHRAALIDEEKHYNTLKRVFGTPEGLEVLEWLLTDVCGYWRGRLDTERELGKFELGRLVFNQVCIADVEIAHSMLDRRRRQAEAIRNQEKRKVDVAAKKGGYDPWVVLDK